ncbi:MAG TPA: GNAT family N-acetyltransferase [Polyangiales bacterium]|nr:GNAT family N-acetyltransferase [Polyangiales bacterium]
MTQLTQTPRTTFKRHPERGSYDRALVHAIVDEALCCHLGLVVDGEPLVLPTAHARIDDQVYVHGAVANHMLRSVVGRRACATFTLIDGVVLARTAFHHSMNYRSVVVFGVTREVEDLDEKRLALAAIVDHTAPGRSREVGTPSDAELRSTRVLCLPIEEASAKVRRGGPLDGAGDLELPVWAGVLPLRVRAEPPLRAAGLLSDMPPSAAANAAASARGGDAVYELQRGELLFSSDPGRIDFELVHQFLAHQSYWAAGISAERLRESLAHSLCFGAYQRGTQLGFARFVTDRARFAYLCDVFIDTSRRKAGFGSALVRFALEHPAIRAIPRVLLGTRDAHPLYERLGFERDARGRFMELVR